MWWKSGSIQEGEIIKGEEKESWGEEKKEESTQKSSYYSG